MPVSGSEESPWLGTNLEALIERVLLAMASPPDDINGWPAFKLEKLIGDEYVTTLDSPPSVVWVPQPEDYANPHDQPDDGIAILDARTTCLVKCWGADGRQTEDLRNAVLGTLFTQFSPNAEKPGAGRWYRHLSTGTHGVMCEFRVTLRVPIMAQVWPSALVTSINQGQPTTTNVSVSDWNGGNPEDLP